jgi:NAD-dependent dihydropyrimidine dehydrogenase PreA subunit
MLPKIEKKRCIECGACILVCPVGVFDSGRDSPLVANPSACIGCKICAINCPNDAISFRKKSE